MSLSVLKKPPTWPIRAYSTLSNLRMVVGESAAAKMKRGTIDVERVESLLGRFRIASEKDALRNIGGYDSDDAAEEEDVKAIEDIQARRTSGR